VKMDKIRVLHQKLSGSAVLTLSGSLIAIKTSDGDNVLI